jgi:hypothetical protein
MSFWIHAFCNESVASVTPEELAAGIGERLELLTSLFCPEDEEDPAKVLARLKIENVSGDATFRVFQMRYRADSPAFIRIGRTADVRGVVEEVEQAVLSRRPATQVDEVRRLLAAASEDVSFCLKAHDVEAMGYPLSIAAASYLVEKAGGLIQSGTYSWMVPSGKEVRLLAEFEA